MGSVKQKTRNEHLVYRKIISLLELTRELKSVRAKNKIVFTNGCWDVLHAGHLKSLRFARSHGDKLIVAVNSDESVRRLKGPTRPIYPLKERMDILSEFLCVDYVIAFEEDTPENLIREIEPDILVKGSQYRSEHVVGSDLVGSVLFCENFPDRSTTNTIKKIEDYKLNYCHA